MSILVVCTKCRSRFQVSDKFAGKSGPCPKCKAVIQVPTAKEEVKVHGPDEFASGGRNAAGQLVGKPIARTEVRLNWVVATGIAAAAVAVVIFAWIAGKLFQNYMLMRLIGLLVVSPPMVIGAYSFLRNDELEPYRGKSLYLRAGVCSLAYIALWGVFGYVAGRALTGDLWNWIYVAPPFLIVGSLCAFACFDLEFGNGFFHYAFFVLLTMLLRWVAGMGWLWQPPAPTPLG